MSKGVNKFIFIKKLKYFIKINGKHKTTMSSKQFKNSFACLAGLNDSDSEEEMENEVRVEKLEYEKTIVQKLKDRRSWFEIMEEEEEEEERRKQNNKNKNNIY